MDSGFALTMTVFFGLFCATFCPLVILDGPAKSESQRDTGYQPRVAPLGATLGMGITTTVLP